MKNDYNTSVQEPLIDSHAHLSLGTVYPPFGIPELQSAMQTKGISHSIVSFLDVIEFGHAYQPEVLPTMGELDGAKTLASLIENHPTNTIFPLIWVRPRDLDKDNFFDWVSSHKTAFYGWKFHPFHSRLPLDDEKWGVYFEVAKMFHWPIVIHTAIDEFSQASRVAKWAEKFPEVSIILVHMGLYTDHQEAITMVARYPNVYGDTTWVKEDDIWRIIERCSPEKILFGTDALVGGEATYDFYTSFLKNLKQFPDLFRCITQENAKKLFHLTPLLG